MFEKKNTGKDAEKEKKYNELAEKAESLGLTVGPDDEIKDLEKAISKAEKEAEEKAEADKEEADEKAKAAEKDAAGKGPVKGTLKTDTSWDGKDYKKGEKAPAAMLEWITKAKQKLSDFVE